MVYRSSVPRADGAEARATAVGAATPEPTVPELERAILDELAQA